MDNKERSIITTGLCFLQIVVSAGTALGIVVQKNIVASNPVFNEYLCTYYGKPIRNLYWWSDYIWLILSLAYIFAAIMSYRRQENARRGMVIIAIVDIVFFLVLHFIAYTQGNFIFKFTVELFIFLLVRKLLRNLHDLCEGN
jgi:hypothetical protein